MAASIITPSPSNADAPKANPQPQQPQQSRRELAASYLGAGFSVSAAARQAGVHRATIYAWLEDPKFNLLVENARNENRDLVRNDIHDVLRLALDSFRQLLSDPKTPPAVRLRASIAALNQDWRALNFLFMNGINVPPKPDHWLESAPESSLDTPVASSTTESDKIRHMTPSPTPKSDTIRQSTPPSTPQPDTIRQKTTPIAQPSPNTPDASPSSLKRSYGLPDTATRAQLLQAMFADSLRRSK